ncbi:MAG: glycosyltransferase family 39 protein, partial [Thermoplasmata archaeon]|nr:glycosyltransferase family 39 protein [Thermoplasmata archaeon]
MAETETSTNQSEGSASRFVSAMRLRMKGVEWKSIAPLLIVLMIFLLALFLRSYFAYDLSANNGYLVSGGSDSYYYERLMDHAATTGEHLHIDPMLNFPSGARNPRPPLYTFSVATPAVFFQGMFASLDDAVGFFLIWSTALFGALTIIPTYLIARDMFGRRVGYVAALFLAILPAHVERSVATLADHDSFALFFIVLTIYFLMKALKTSINSKWIENWLSFKSIRAGLGGFASQNKKAILYSLLAGLSFSAIAMAWVGFAYVEVILLAFFVIQILINKFKGVDSTTITLLLFIAFGFAFLLTFPVYWQMDIFAVRFDVPVYLFLGAVIVGIMFSATRDYPWLLVLPVLAIVLGIALMAITVISPAIGEAIFTGQGYFSVSKLYSTIAEARAPIYSQLAVSFGIVTFYLSFIGLFLMLYRIPKHPQGDYIAISVWLAIAIFMAASAGRFMFNAAPAFAISASWITLLIIDKLDFRRVGKLFISSSGNILQVFRKSVKIRHIVGALFVIFMLILPNLWSSLDAGIPSESKRAIDQQIYNSFPDFLRAESYGNSLRYLGSFGYSLPLPTYYFPAFWDWFSQQDPDIIPAQERPGYVSWWDYGFEAIQAGEHPAVADNFQQGYEIAGNILLAPSEEEAIGLMIARLVQPTVKNGAMPQDVMDALSKYNASPETVLDVITSPAQYRDIVISNSDKYGSTTADISTTNIIWRYLGVHFADLGLETEVNIYNEIREVTGNSIGYIGIDSRLIPKAATDVGVFYAPVKLTDRPVDDDNNPTDYFVIKAIDDTGVEYTLEQARKAIDINIVDYKLVYYKDFYNTMLYRACGGVPPSEIGKQNDGLPGLSGSVADTMALPGWNLTHFILVYRTTYYNPEKDGSGTWRAISQDMAEEYSQKISAKEMEGVLDTSPAVMYQAGAILLKYYDGAVMSGTIRDSNGDPAPGIRITVLDRYGIPHQTVPSDLDGKYSIILPPGQDTVIISSGTKDNIELTGANKISEISVEVTDEMAMRENVDSDGDGRMDWEIAQDFTVPSGTISGHVFWDINNDGNYTEGADIPIDNALIVARHSLNPNITYQFVPENGNFEGLATTGSYNIDTYVNNIETISEFTVTVQPGALAVREVSRKPATISGTVQFYDGDPAQYARVIISAEEPNLYPTFSETLTDDSGAYSFEQILPGRYLVSTILIDEYSGTAYSAVGRSVQPTAVENDKTADFVIRPSGILNIQAYDSHGNSLKNATVKIASTFSPTEEGTTLRLDGDGQGEFIMPEGTFSLTIRTPTETGVEVGGTSVEVVRFAKTNATINIGPAVKISGVIGPLDLDEIANAVFYDGFTAYLVSTSATEGTFNAYLPQGQYDAIFFSGDKLATMKINAPASGINATMENAVELAGAIWHDRNNNGLRDSNENIAFANIRVALDNGVILKTRSDIEGHYSLYVPRNSRMDLLVKATGYEDSQSITLVTSGTGISRLVSLNLAPVKMEGILEGEDGPLRDVTIQFINVSRTVTMTSNSKGIFSGEILPGIYEISILDQISRSSPVYYYHSSMIAIYVGMEINDITLRAEQRIKVTGEITGVPMHTSVFIKFQGPSDYITDAERNYEAYLKTGTYSCYAYDADNRDYGNLLKLDVSLESYIINIPLLNANEISGRMRIGSRAGNYTDITVIDVSDGAEVLSFLPPGGTYQFVLPNGTYEMQFDMRVLDDLGRIKRYLLLSNHSTIALAGDTVFEPQLGYNLDNSSLYIYVRDESGQPLMTEVRFVSLDEYAYSETYATDNNGLVSSSVHPGFYTVYIADSITGLSYLDNLEVNLEKNVSLNITLERGYVMTVSATAENSTQLDYLGLVITKDDGTAELKFSV